MLIEDAAQAHGAAWRGRKVGSLGDAGCFSFYPTKNMTTGEGGMVTTDDDALAAHIRRLINHGQAEKYLHTELGYNYRMTDLGGAIGRVQLRRLPGFNERRQENGAYLSAHLDAPGIVPPVVGEEMTHVYHQYVVTVTDDCPLSATDWPRTSASRESAARSTTRSRSTSSRSTAARRRPAPVRSRPIWPAGSSRSRSTPASGRPNSRRSSTP